MTAYDYYYYYYYLLRVAYRIAINLQRKKKGVRWCI